MGRGSNKRGLPPTRELAEAAFGFSARLSPQRLAIVSAVEASSRRAFSVEDLADEVRRDSPGMGLATVYRAIAAMQATGFIEAVGEREGAAVYARCARKRHHHHLVCTTCGAVADVGCPAGIDVGGDAGGFRVTGHSLVLHGVCPECQRDEPQEGVS